MVLSKILSAVILSLVLVAEPLHSTMRYISSKNMQEFVNKTGIKLYNTGTPDVIAPYKTQCKENEIGIVSDTCWLINSSDDKDAVHFATVCNANNADNTLEALLKAGNWVSNKNEDFQHNSWTLKKSLIFASTGLSIIGALCIAKPWFRRTIPRLSLLSGGIFGALWAIKSAWEYEAPLWRIVDNLGGANAEYALVVCNINMHKYLLKKPPSRDPRKYFGFGLYNLCPIYRTDQLTIKEAVDKPS